jgi:hypothetical protein
MKEKIKAWLKSTHRDRNWLGDQIGVTKKTVDNWLSSPQPIPEAKLQLIQRVMESSQKSPQDPTLPQVFSVEVSLPRFRQYSYCAKMQHRTLEEWVISELDIAAENYFATEHQPPEPTPPEKSKPLAIAIATATATSVMMEAPAGYAVGQIPVTPEQKAFIEEAARIEREHAQGSTPPKGKPHKPAAQDN